MIFLDAIFLGWYRMLDKTIYVMARQTDGIGAKEHSFFIGFLLHSINASTLIRFGSAKYFDALVPLYLTLFISAVIFLMGYIVYFRRARANQIIEKQLSLRSLILTVSLSLTYAAVSIYLLLAIGDYIRAKQAFE